MHLYVGTKYTILTYPGSAYKFACNTYSVKLKKRDFQQIIIISNHLSVIQLSSSIPQYVFLQNIPEAATVSSKRDFITSLMFVCPVQKKFREWSAVYEGKQLLPSKNSPNFSSHSWEILKKNESYSNYPNTQLNFLQLWQGSRRSIFCNCFLSETALSIDSFSWK